MNKQLEALAPPTDERCDSCGAAGKLRVRFPEGGDLVFCGHHANRNAEGLVKVAVEVAAEPGFSWRGLELMTA